MGSPWGCWDRLPAPGLSKYPLAERVLFLLAGLPMLLPDFSWIEAWRQLLFVPERASGSKGKAQLLFRQQQHQLLPKLQPHQGQIDQVQWFQIHFGTAPDISLGATRTRFVAAVAAAPTGWYLDQAARLVVH